MPYIMDLDATDNQDGFQQLLLKYTELVVSMSKWYQRGLLGEGMLNSSDQDSQQKKIETLEINLI